ncbi:MAG: tetratricopeptide repeat protein [Planctomycetota bacterium]
MKRKTEIELAPVLSQADALEKEGRYADAISLYDRAIAEMPHVARLYALRGYCWFALKRFSEAERDFTQAIERKADVPTTLFYRARAREEQGKLREALEDYRKSAELKCDQSDVFLNMGLIYEYLKEYGDAIASYENALRIEPRNHVVRNSLEEVRRKVDHSEGS